MNEPRLSVLMLLAATACGGAAPLDGSLATEVDLSYTRATLEPSGGTLALRFLRPRGEQWDTSLKVAVDVSDLPAVGAGTALDLAEVLPSGGQRGSVTRNVYEEEATTFPLLSRGRLRLESSPATSRTVAGELSLTFEAGSDFACGKAVFGAFVAEVVTP